jgi:mono/diheme cytochrome c family protein
MRHNEVAEYKELTLGGKMGIRTKRNWVIAALAAVTLMAAGMTVAHDEDWKVPDAARNLKNPIAPSPDGIATASAIYKDKCANCHGDKGVGDGPEATMYDPQPANLADAHMMAGMTDGEIFYKITEGRKPMPGFKQQLSDEQRWQLVNFLRTLSAKPAGGKPGK